jgi:hypothetical protein
MFKHPVFGPERPRAARAAIRELAAAHRASHPFQSADVKARIVRAQVVRDMYPEYGDTFRTH